jgi:hypothetical protein
MEPPLSAVLDLDRYPLDRADDPALARLVAEKRREWLDGGACRLEALIRPEMAARASEELEAPTRSVAFRHVSRHNVYFTDTGDGLPADIAALDRRTASWTLTRDQMVGTIIDRVHGWAPLRDFIRRVLDKPALYPMADPMAGLNVMTYDRGDQLDWHFDRAEFAVTILLRAADHGGAFEYRRNLRSADDPNHDGIRAVLAGTDPDVGTARATPGTMTLFAGRNSLHRVAPVTGSGCRRMAVLSYMEEPGYLYSAEDRMRFYGRPSPDAPPNRGEAAAS